MEHNFQIGEVVVCVNARRRWYRLGGLTKGEMYTVTGFNPIDGGLILKEAKSPRSGCNAYRADRFRKVDYNFAQQVIQYIQPEKEERVSINMLTKKYALSLLN